MHIYYSKHFIQLLEYLTLSLVIDHILSQFDFSQYFHTIPYKCIVHVIFSGQEADEADFSSSSQIIILQRFTFIRLLPFHFYLILSQPTETPFQRNTFMFNVRFTKTPYSFELMPQVVSIPNHRPMPRQSSLLLFCRWIVIILYLSALYSLSTKPIQTLGP